MNVKRFVGRTARDAMRKLRDELGPDALVLANRPCAEGVEMLATLPQGGAPLEELPEGPPTMFAPEDDEAPALHMGAARQSASHTPPPMSTVSFQDYVRQRLRDRNREPAESRPVPPQAAPAQFASPRAPRMTLGAEYDAARMPVMPQAPAAAPVQPSRPRAPMDMAQAARNTASSTVKSSGLDGLQFDFDTPAAASRNADTQALMAEMQALKGMISQQFDSMRWFDEVSRSPIQGHLLRTLVESGFSLRLARSVVGRLPADYSPAQATVWLAKILARNLRVLPHADTFSAGGVYALVGPTGVGKTTTTAKIAAQHVLRHGPQSVALITVDTYRLGAHDQLRAFGRILNVPVHVAHDAEALADLVRLRESRQLVLIDTVGMSHRDERIASLLGMLPGDSVRRVVVASCAAQAETIDESLRAYDASTSQGVILTKLDEAARLGGALDCLLRAKLPLLGVSDGQRVPEDWQQADPDALVRRALNASRGGAFDLHNESLPTLFGMAHTGQGDILHA
jgi:flagellar biosynthesis protein FlhF